MTVITYDDLPLYALQGLQDLIIQSQQGSFLHSLCAMRITDRTVNFLLDILQIYIIFFKPTFGLN